MRSLIVIVFLGTWFGWSERGAYPRVTRLPPNPATVNDTLWVDVEQTVIKWKGTKFWGLGKHEGIVRLASGSLRVREGKLLGGSFIIDMTSIAVTDMPAHEHIPRRRLRNHLMSDDFFAVETYPTAVFVLTSLSQQEGRTYHTAGNLTMRGRTHPVTFETEMVSLTHDRVEATAQFSINRQDWGVAYRGSSLTNDLVDDEIYLDVYLVAKR